MRNIFLLIAGLLLLFIMVGCTPATNDSIIGTWEQTHSTMGIPYSGGFYKFNSNGTYQESMTLSGLNYTGASYSMSGNVLRFDSGSYDVYILGTTMYWYKSNVEQYRFKKN